MTSLHKEVAHLTRRYNTAVFASTTASAYDYFVVSEDFLTANATFNATASDRMAELSYYNYAVNDEALLLSLHNAVLNGSLVKLENSDCMSKYGTTFVTDALNLLLITTDTNINTTYLYAQEWASSDEVPYAWLCGDTWSSMPYQDHMPVCTLSEAHAGASNWVVGTHPISYCLVQEVEEECRLQFSLAIMIVVILANATKALIMILTWRNLRTPTLATIGDAIASFLDDPDQTTVGICLTDKRDIMRAKGIWKNLGAKRWIPVRHFWFRAASLKRWLTCNILCWSFIVLGIVLLREGMTGVGIYDLKTLWQLGFGRVSTSAIVGIAPSGLIAKVLFANLPQGILSFLYLTYNGLYTCMLGAHEWSLFATQRRGVRVTSPVGKQRSTYYLALPYWYAVVSA